MKSNTIKISYRTACLLAVIGFVLAGAGPGFAQRMPQDNWYYIRQWGEYGSGPGQFDNPSGIAVGANGHVYVLGYNSTGRTQAFDENGKFLRDWNAGNWSLGIAVGPTGQIYTVGTADKVRVFNTNGVLQTEWGSEGSGEGQLVNPVGVDVHTNGYVYVADTGNHRIQVFDATGAFVRAWGTLGSASGEFNTPYDIAVHVDGLVYVADTENNRIQVFKEDGTFVRAWNCTRAVGIDIDNQGVVYTMGGTGWNQTHLRMWDSQGNELRYVTLPGDNNVGYASAAVSREDRLYVTLGDLDVVYAYGRAARTMGGAPIDALPQPRIVSATQRQGTTYVDIDYVVSDPDSTNASTALLAFTDGANTLNNVLRLNTFVEGTDSNVGDGIPSDTKMRVTWDAAADWSADFGQVEFEILARANDKLMDIHYITIPSNGPDPELTISRSPILDSDFLSCWYWLIATNDTAINLVSGKVYGASGPYTGLVLADGVITTTNGRAFLFERMNVQEASAAQVARARMGLTPGTTNMWNPRVPIGPTTSPMGAIVRPMKVNECGFDTGNWGAGPRWVVPLD